MRFIIVILFSLTLLCSQDISEKLIVSADINYSSMKMQLLKLKMVFIENAKTRELQEKYHLNIALETLGDHTMVVIKPIKSLAVKNELLLLLRPLYPDVFSINDNTMEPTISQSMIESNTIITQAISTNASITQQAEDLIKEIGLQWLALLLLSIIGLTLSLNSRRKMTNLEKMQKELSQKQACIENEIKNLGAFGV